MPNSRLFLARIGVVAAASVIALIGVPAGPAVAHEHPTPVTLQTPAVVRVNTFAEVRISLIEHDARGAHVGLQQRTYRVPVSSGSGFVVDPSGVVVTSATAVAMDVERAQNYAVNHIFNDIYGDAAPLPEDEFAAGPRDIPGGDPVLKIPERLQMCREPNQTDDSGGCVAFTDRVVQVQPLVDSQERHGNLAAEVVNTEEASDDLAVLKVGGGSMPTVELGESMDEVENFSVLGFTGTPGDGTSLQRADGHFTEPGSGQVVRDEYYGDLTAAVADGLAGGPLIGESGAAVGFLTSPAGGGEPSAVGAAQIREALSAAGLTPRRGPVDATYENAMHAYNNDLHAAAVPFLERTQGLYPGHAPAGEALAIAQAEGGRGAGASVPAAGAVSGSDRADAGGGPPVWVWLGFGVAVPLMAAVAVLRNRRAGSAGGPSGVVAR